MTARLGNVLYWLGCGIAAAFAALWLVVMTNPGNEWWVFSIIYGGLGLASWLLGRALRYILAGT